MKISRRIAINLAYILILMMVIAGMTGTINDRNKDIILLQEKHGLLLKELEESRHQKDILEEILLKDKREIQKLQEENERLKTIRARVTAYSPMDNKSGICADEDPETTATGTKPEVGIAASDPKKIPYGTKLYIPGYGNAIIEDTGAALRRGRGLRLDVVMNTYEEAMDWGVKELDVIIQ